MMIIFKFLKINDNYIDFFISIIFIYFFYLFKFILIFIFFYWYLFFKIIVKIIIFNVKKMCYYRMLNRFNI